MVVVLDARDQMVKVVYDFQLLEGGKHSTAAQLSGGKWVRGQLPCLGGDFHYLCCADLEYMLLAFNGSARDGSRKMHTAIEASSKA
jgi:hypothetical protein